MDLQLLLFDFPTNFIDQSIFFQLGLIVLLIQFIVLIFYCLAVRKLLISIRPHNRFIHPDLVWLGLIPIFRLVWPLVMNPLVRNSVKRDMTESGIDEYGDYGLFMGVSYPVLGIAKLFIEPFGNIVAIPEFLVWVFFWRKLNDYRARIVEFGGVSDDTDLLDN